MLGDNNKTNKSLIMSYLNKFNDLRERVNDLEDDKWKLVLSKVLDNMQLIFDNYSNFLKDSFNDDFRYIDYFSYELKENEIIPYFNDNYNKDDYEERLPQFIMFGLFSYLYEIFDMYESMDFCELCYLIDANNYFDKISHLSSALVISLENSKWNSANQEQKLPFLDNKYKIFFTGLSLDDIENLEPTVRMQLIHKLNTPLSTEVVIPKAEAIDHVKEAYKFPIQRIQFADDYRIAFVRFGDVTVILGVTMKTGKDSDYTRYDIIGRRKDLLYDEIEEFIAGKTPLTASHFKVIEILEKTYKKKFNKGKV